MQLLANNGQNSGKQYQMIKKLRKLAKQYNDLIQQYNMELPQAIDEDILSGKFPWSSLSSKLGIHCDRLELFRSGRYCVSVQEKHKISTVYNQIQRLKEESLLLLEMTQYLMYFKSSVPNKLECENDCVYVLTCVCTACIIEFSISH